MSQKSSFSRLLLILKRLNEGKKINISHFAEEQDVSVRTVRRDFELIKEVFDDFLIKNGEIYHSVQKNILNDVLTGSDLGTLMSVLDIFSASGSSFKIDNNLKKIYSNSKQIYKFATKPFEELKNREVISKIEKAISYKQVITITYKKLDDEIELEVKPYKILFLNENYYLASGIDNQYRFLLSRIGLITDVKVQTQTFYPHRPIELFVDRIQTPWAKYKENKNDVEIIVEVPKSISKYFQMKKYLPSQKILEVKDDETLVIQYMVSDLFEIKELVMKWLPKMKIISPVDLKKMVKIDLEKKLESL